MKSFLHVSGVHSASASASSTSAATAATKAQQASKSASTSATKALEELIKDPEIIPPALIFPVVAIASIYAFAQYNDVVPKSLALSVDGTRG